jgi:hypothetical protein
MVKLTLKVAQDLAKLRGGECLSTVYINTDTKMQWRCKEGHEWPAKLNHVKDSGSWCGKCATAARKKTDWIETAKAYAVRRGGLCLSDECIDDDTILEWQCSDGHKWPSTYRNAVYSGKWCGWCSGRHNNSIELVRQIAQERGGVCESIEYINVITLMQWRCAEGHPWPATFNSIKNNGSWCPVCAGRYDHLPEMVRHAEAKGGQCLAEEAPATVKDHVMWRCAAGHKWPASPDNVLNNGRWCPNCRYRSEDAVRQLFEAITGKPFPKRTGVLTEYAKLELDGYCKSIRVAFEYQGIQHYQFVPHFHRRGRLDLARQRARDRLKAELCIYDEIVLIVVPHYLKDIEGFVRSELESLGVAL